MSDAASATSRLAELHRRRPHALAQLLEEEIKAEELASGVRLGTKRDLQAKYGVATTTVNEAIRLLENRGLVQSKPGPGGGVFVAERSGWLALSGLVLDFQHSVTAAAEVLEVRDAIELLIMRQAALHHTSRDILELHELLKAMETTIADPRAYLKANWAFHRRAAQLCSNEFARRLYEGLLDFAESQLANVREDERFDGLANLATHENLLNAIASRDPDRVVAAVERHNAQSRVTRQILA
jgi:DNA-binding FadR family transcriptional regulator